MSNGMDSAVGESSASSCDTARDGVSAAHASVEQLLVNAQDHRIMLAHALVALGKPLRCSMPECARGEDGRDLFEPLGPNRLSIDHAQRREDGGNHRPENLRFAHLGCNVAAQNRPRIGKLPPERSYTSPDAFDQLSRVQQDLVEFQHGPQADDSRWRFTDGVAERIA